MSAVTDGVDSRDNEAARVYSWRLFTFRGMGFTVADAKALADSTVSSYDVKKLIDAGCNKHTAKEILT